MKNSELNTNKLFGGFFAGGRRLGPAVGVFLAIVELIRAAAVAAEFCQKTSQDALEGCQDNAEGDHSIALGKCANFSDAAERAVCRQQAATDFVDGRTHAAMRSTRGRRPAKDSAVPYDPVIDPANFIHVVNNPYFPSASRLNKELSYEVMERGKLSSLGSGASRAIRRGAGG